MPADAVYVGRGSPWGNPWEVRSHRGKWVLAFEGAVVLDDLDTRQDAQVAAVEYFALGTGVLGSRELTDDDLAPLRGKDLACWCDLSAPCHADVLLERANHV